MTRRMARVALVLVLVIAGCGSAHATTTTAASTRSACSEPPATLRFAWPETLTARVVGRDLTQSQNDDGSNPMEGDSYADLRLVTAAEGTGRVLRFEPAGRTRLRSQGLAPDIGGARPTVHLDRTGSVTRVDGSAEMAATIQQAVAAGQLDRESAQMLLGNTTEATQTGTAAAHWNWLLHVWDGQTLECGVPVRSRALVPSLSFGTASVDTDSELLFAGHVDCGGEPVGTGGCVHLQVRQHDVGASARDAIARSGVGGGARVDRATFTRTIDLVTEPASLVPHSVVFEELWQITWAAQGRTFTRLIRDRQEYVFDYGAAPQPPAQRWIVTRDGQPMTRPDTPRCRWIDACCAALAQVSSSAGLMCGIIVPEPGADCTQEDLDAVRGVGLTVSPDHVPPACTVSAPP